MVGLLYVVLIIDRYGTCLYMGMKSTTKSNETYNGYTNYETWNVALWIQNDEGLYNLALSFADFVNPYESFLEYFQGFSDNTPDGIKWDDPKINKKEINLMFRDLLTD